jgi:protein TFG
MDLSGKLIIKVQLGQDIRRIPIHNDDITYDELILMMQRIYRNQLQPQDELLLKYKDEDDDHVTLADQSDLDFAIQCSRILRIIIHVKGHEDESHVELSAKHHRAVTAELRRIRDQVNHLLDSLDLSQPNDGDPSITTQSDSKFASKVLENGPSTHVTKPIATAVPTSHKEFDPLSNSAHLSGLAMAAESSAPLENSQVIAKPVVSSAPSIMGGSSLLSSNATQLPQAPQPQVATLPPTQHFSESASTLPSNYDAQLSARFTPVNDQSAVKSEADAFGDKNGASVPTSLMFAQPSVIMGGPPPLSSMGGSYKPQFPSQPTNFYDGANSGAVSTGQSSPAPSVSTAHSGMGGPGNMGGPPSALPPRAPLGSLPPMRPPGPPSYPPSSGGAVLPPSRYAPMPQSGTQMGPQYMPPLPMGGYYGGGQMQQPMYPGGSPVPMSGSLSSGVPSTTSTGGIPMPNMYSQVGPPTSYSSQSGTMRPY